MDYHAKIAAHLSRYKEFHLGIRGSGKERRGRPALLPDEYKDLNILPEYRQPFRHYSLANPLLRLQQDFRDLHSSQALCFNLFIPFVQEKKRQPLLLQTLGLEKGRSLAGSGFDFSFGDATDEYFDFYFTLPAGESWYFDIKLAETWFGPSHQSGISSDALLASSRQDITGLIAGWVLKSPEVAKLIVLLKKLSFIASADLRRLCCIFPAGNNKLQEAMALLQDSLYPNIRERLVVIPLEDFIDRVMAAAGDKNDLYTYFQKIRHKYIPA